VRRLCHEQRIDGCDSQNGRPDQPKSNEQCVAIHDAPARVAPAPNGLGRDWSLTRVAAGRSHRVPGTPPMRFRQQMFQECALPASRSVTTVSASVVSTSVSRYTQSKLSRRLDRRRGARSRVPPTSTLQKPDLNPMWRDSFRAESARGPSRMAPLTLRRRGIDDCLGRAAGRGLHGRRRASLWTFRWRVL
jgi:hypothetical protein